MHLIDADALEREGWYINRIIQTSKTAMEYQTKKPTEFPAIEPERKTGKWIRALDGIDGHVRCSQCFKIYDWDMQAQYYTFCPNCGADMRGEQDG